jgi:hypothetical protein
MDDAALQNAACQWLQRKESNFYQESMPNYYSQVEDYC